MRHSKNSRAAALHIKARAYYKEAVATVDDDPNVTAVQKAKLLNDYGLMFNYYDLEDDKTAIEYFRKALALDETCTDACYNYGKLLRRMGKPKEALAILEKAAKRPEYVMEEIRAAKRDLRKL